ncbi:MAG: DNA/RNA nuclease SfsA, partial [Lachnospiraceae bacterium]|nr:DNA/RNA nuclease SfsA [Lachnospiraceae bacterium]
MRYPNITEAIFQSRPNRFIAMVEINGKTEKVHVKNTGRCRELLLPGAKVYLVHSDNPERKT